MDQATTEAIHRIWDQLAEFPVSRSGDEALQFLLESISSLIHADHAYWLSALRMEHIDSESDVMMGWRPGPAFYYPERQDDRKHYDRAVKEYNDEPATPKESTLNLLQRAGEFRAYRLRDLVSPAFFRSEGYRDYYQSRQVRDTLFVVAPVNQDVEVYFSFNRLKDNREPFRKADLDIAAATLRSLNWFHRNVLLGHGHLIADKPLTPTERRVLHWLLTELPEKQIAGKLRQQFDTTHKHVLRIYRKFNVNSRAGLMAIWLGHPG